MRLKSLYIKDYKILQDFNIDFTSNLSVLIGENGSGKSSIIECLAYIFGHLHKYFVLNDKTAEFIEGYKINYTINGLDVYIESKYVESETNTFQPIIKINGENMSTTQLKRQNETHFLPEKIILSYSGITERLNQLSKHFEEKFIQKIIRQNNPYSLRPLVLPSDNPFMYAKKEYVSFILLALFVLNTEEANKLIDKLGIDIYGCEILITLKKPSWAKSNKNKKKNTNIWGMSGKIASDLLGGLRDFYVDSNNGQEEEPSKLEFLLYGSPMVRDLFRDYYNLNSNQIVPFLETLLCDDLLESIDITWNNNFSIEKLSEGEKQMILSVGLSLVLNQKNLLFLLDEPDVSLHPKWQQDFIGNFTQGLNKDSMAVITTHSPSLATDLSNHNLSLIRKGKIVTKSFKYYGKKIDDILYDYFGLESMRNKDIAKKIELLWTMIQNNNYHSDEFVRLKEEVVKIIGVDDSDIIAMNRDILRKTNEKNK